MFANYSCDGKAELLQSSVLIMLICCSRNMSYYYQC